MHNFYNNRVKQNSTTAMMLIAAVIGLFVILSVGKSAEAQEGVRIAAVVNDEAISLLDLESRIVMAIASSNVADGADTRRRMAPSILRRLIEERLMQQEMRRLNIKVSMDEVEQGIKTIEKQNGLKPGGLQEFLQSAGIPMSALISRTEVEIGWSKVIRRVIVPSIRISDDEINDTIRTIKSNAGKPQYLLAEIYLPINDTAEESSVKQVADQLFNQLKNGVSFPQIARNFSRSASAATGGDLGWLSYEQIDQEISAVVRLMKPGQVSVPIRTLGGYYIITLRDERLNPGLISNETTLGLSQFHLSIGPDATTEEKTSRKSRLVSMVGKLNSCDEFNKAAATSGSPLSGSLGNVKLSALPPEMSAELKSLSVGSISNPFETGGGIAVIMVCSRDESGNNVESIKKEIEEKILIERVNIAAAGYLRELKRDAFLEIRL
ncbi:MAG: peptidylprolyl isomerase [Rhodospirillaceae bacterium]|nr:peptidylprolyl isomerase [Rhodospirillaceae bacterium]